MTAHGPAPDLNPRWPHGTWNRYGKGCRCRECKDAANTYIKRLRAKQLETYGFIFHGTPKTYNRGCRCRPCTDAANKADRDRRARRRSA